METSKSNTALWDELKHTDPSHTKPFSRPGGFKGTAIKPMWSYLRMTEKFGPCGTGWGIGNPVFQVVSAGDESLVFCTVTVWYEKPTNVLYGVGGDKVAGKNSSGVRTDDEAFKKAFTDGVTNALKMIGVGADVHLGQFDDNKYVNDMKAKFGEDETSKPENQPTAPQAKPPILPHIFDKMKADLQAAPTVADVEASKRKIDKWIEDNAATATPSAEQLATIQSLYQAAKAPKIEQDEIPF